MNAVKQTGRLTGKSGRQTDRQLYRQEDKETGRRAISHTDRQTHRQEFPSIWD